MGIKILVLVVICLIPLFIVPSYAETIEVNTDKMIYGKNEMIKVSFSSSVSIDEKFGLHVINGERTPVSQTITLRDVPEISFSTYNLSSNYQHSGVYEIRLSLYLEDETISDSAYVLITDGNFPESFVGTEADAIDINKDYNKIYIANSRSNDYVDYRGIIITDLDLNIQNYISFGKSNIGDVKINQVTKKAYATMLNANAIMVVDVKTDKILNLIPLIEDDLAGNHQVLHQINPRSLTIDELTNTIYFSYDFQVNDPLRNIGGIGIIDGNSDSIIDNISLNSSPWKLIIDEKSKKIFVGSVEDQKSKLLVIDSKTKESSNELIFDISTLGGFSIHDNKLFIAQAFYDEPSGKILVLDITNEKIVDSFETGIEPWSTAIDSKTNRLFVTTNSPTGLQVFDIDSGIFIKSLETTGHHETLVFDDDNNLLFLGMSNVIKKIPIESKIPQDGQSDLFDNANQLYYGKNFEDALVIFSQVIELDPLNVEAHTKKGYSLFMLERDEEAKRSFEQALKIDPNYVNATFGLADVNYFLGNPAEAKNLYEKGLQANPDDASALSFLGMTLSELNDESGLNYIEESISLEPENIDFLYNKAVALNNLQKYEEAISTLDKVLEHQPDAADALDFKNTILKDSGILKEQRLSTSFPEKVESRCDLVYLINKVGEEYGSMGFPQDDVLDEIEKVKQEYLPKFEAEPWNTEELNLEMFGKWHEIMVENVMQKYSIDPKLRSTISELLELTGTYDLDVLRGLMLMKPEHYAEDVECGKMLKTHYYDTMFELNVAVYGEDTAEKMGIAIDEAIAEAVEKRKSDPLSVIEDTMKNIESEIKCGTGTIEQNGQCVLDPNFVDEEPSSGGGGCLIATATFDSELAPQVQMLREIRDNSLLQTQSGQFFMGGFNQFYYSFSPTIADYERQNPVFKEAVKVTITPLVASLSLLNFVDLNSEESVLGYGIGIIMMNIGMYFVAPAIVIHRIKNS